MSRRRIPELAAALAGLGWFVLLGGGRALVPTNLDWLGHGDRAFQLVAWLLFRNEPWQLPLGRIDGLLYPVGSSVAFADAIPLVAIVGKLASPLLPTTFQYLGPWMAACFACQGWFGARLVACWSDRPVHRFLGGTLLVLAPPLTARAVDGRMLHPSLCGQWVLVAVLGLACLPPALRPDPRRALVRAAALDVLAVLIHPALAAMALVVTLAFALRLALERAMAPLPLAAWSALGFVGVATGLALLGYFDGTPGAAEGFGEYSADALFLCNPMWLSRFLPGLSIGSGQYEGFGYLGLGTSGLVFAAMVLLARARKRPTRSELVAWGPLLLVAAGMALFALASPITVAGIPVLSLDGLYSRLGPVAGAFRSSGRFVWPLHYLVVAAALAIVLRAWSGRTAPAAAVLGAALAVQAVDLSPSLTRDSFREGRWRLESPAWDEAARDFRHLALVPPAVPQLDDPCFGAYEFDHFIPFAFEAYLRGATINSGYAARLDEERTIESCRRTMAEVRRGLREDTLYVVAPGFLQELRGAVCGPIDGHVVCVASSARTRFGDLLAGRTGSAPP